LPCKSISNYKLNFKSSDMDGIVSAHLRNSSANLGVRASTPSRRTYYSLVTSGPSNHDPGGGVIRFSRANTSMRVSTEIGRMSSSHRRFGKTLLVPAEKASESTFALVSQMIHFSILDNWKKKLFYRYVLPSAMRHLSSPVFFEWRLMVKKPWEPYLPTPWERPSQCWGRLYWDGNRSEW